MNLCVFQGTFNPFHNAHMRLAQYALDKYNFDKLLFIPAYKPPHKDYDDKMAYHRLNMVKLAVSEANNPKFDVSDIEYKRDEKSYTYITVQKLYEMFNIDTKINFIIGTDAFDKIESWYEIDKLKDLVKFFVFKREDNCNFEKFEYLKEKGYDFICEELPFKDISSTNLRKIIKNNENFENFVCRSEKEYIENNGIYKN